MGISSGREDRSLCSFSKSTQPKDGGSFMVRMKLGIALVALAALSAPAMAQELTKDMKKGTPDLKSAGPLAFAPEGILLVGDPLGGAVFALATEDTKGNPDSVKLDVPAIDEKVA